MAGKNTNDQKNKTFRKRLHSLLIDDFVFGLLTVLSFVLSFAAYSRTENPYSFGFIALPVGILIFRLLFILVDVAASRRGKKSLSVKGCASSCFETGVGCRKSEEENSWNSRIRSGGVIILLAAAISYGMFSYKEDWSLAVIVVAVLAFTEWLPLRLGGKDYWPGYFFVVKALAFLFIAMLALALFFLASNTTTNGDLFTATVDGKDASSFVCKADGNKGDKFVCKADGNKGDSNDKDLCRSAFTLAFTYVVLYLLPLGLMLYIARKDDPGTREFRKGSKYSVGIWWGWRNAEAARAGAKFAIYPLLFDLIFILMLIPSIDSLVGKIMNAYFSMSTVTYAVNLWNALRDEKEKIEKEYKRNPRPRVRKRQRRSSLPRRNPYV